MFTFKVSKSDWKQVEVIAVKSVIQNGDLILMDINSHVVAAFAKGLWTDVIRTQTPESA